MTETTYNLLTHLLHLTSAVDTSKYAPENHVAAYNAFKAHIEELERKAKAYDAMCPHCGSTVSGCFCPED